MKKSDIIEVQLVAGKGNDTFFHKVYYLVRALVPEGKIFLGTKEKSEMQVLRQRFHKKLFPKISTYHSRIYGK